MSADFYIYIVALIYASFSFGKYVGFRQGVIKEINDRNIQDLKALNSSLHLLSKAKKEFQFRISKDDNK